MATLYDLNIDQGTTKVLLFTWLDASTNLPVDLTDYTANLWVKERHGEQNVVLKLTTDDGSVTLGDAEGTITLIFTDSVLLDLKDYYYVYDLIMTKPDTSTERLLEGQMTISIGITNG